MSMDTQFVTCPECGSEQADMGHYIACEVCGFAPMPTHDDPELDFEEPEPSLFNGVASRKHVA